MVGYRASDFYQTILSPSSSVPINGVSLAASPEDNNPVYPVSVGEEIGRTNDVQPRRPYAILVVVYSVIFATITSFSEA